MNNIMKQNRGNHNAIAVCFEGTARTARYHRLGRTWGEVVSTSKIIPKTEATDGLVARQMVMP